MAKKRGKKMWTPEMIVRLRRSFGENQREFADRIGVAIDTLQNWEQGRVAAPEIAGKLFQFLQIESNQRQTA